MNVKEIPLSRGLSALVDEDTHAELSKVKWYALKSGLTYYAVRWVMFPNGDKILLFMHRVILGLTDEQDKVDHRNNDGLDNRRENLRVTQQVNNCHNRPKTKNKTSSRFKGVYWHKRSKVWVARITAFGKVFELGYFKSEIEAALAYNEAASQHFGEFAWLNTIEVVL